MKKFTLLAIAALAAAGTQMVNAEDINGITASTAENPVYYTITNMRANRMSYVKADHGDGEVAGGQIMSDNDGEGWIVRTDTSGGPWLPEYFNDEPTPEIWSFPYMGLAEVAHKYWTAFSAMPEVMDPQTIYWWFEQEKPGSKAVYIHNAVLDGAVKNKAEICGDTGKYSMSFSETDKEKYYVIPLTEEQLEELFPDGDEFAENAFALSKASVIANPKTGAVVNPNSCLDMNNYISYNYEVETGEFNEVEQVGEDGEPIYDEDGNPVVERVPVMAKYGFAGVNLTWNPLNEAGGNRSDNNGSLFQVEKVADEDLPKVQAAIKYYEDRIKENYRAQVSIILENEKENTIARLGYLSNLPELYGDKAEKLEAIIADINATTVDPSSVSTQEDVDIKEAEIKTKMEDLYYRAIALAGNGTVITLQQMLAVRDFPAVDEGEGNFYLSATGKGQIKYDGSLEEIGYDAVTCIEEEDETCKWTMEWVPGVGYKLKNGENYIRQFGNWEGMDEQIMDALGLTAEDFETGEEGEEGEGEGEGEGETDNIWNHIDTNVMTWALTKNADLAAIFTFTCNNTAVQEINLSDAHQDNVDLYGEELGYNIEDPEAENYIKNTTNIIHLQSTSPNGNPTYLCRDSADWKYIVDSWAAGNQYFAAPNCWKVKVTTPGEEIQDGIEEINATAKVAGIYDLQGRKVAKAGKGLYIINGVKTLVK